MLTLNPCSPRLAAAGPRARLLSGYVLAVTVAGLGLLVALNVGHGLAIGQAKFWLFTALVLFGERVAIQVSRRGEHGEITLSTTFALALLLIAGPAAAALGLALASLINDLARRKPLVRALFNVGQYSLSLGIAGLLLALVSDVPHRHGMSFHPEELPVILAAAVCFFLVNTLLVAVAVALHQGLRIWPYFSQDFLFQASTAGMLLALAPVVVLAADVSLVLLPLLAAPFVAIFRSERQSLVIEHHAVHDALTGLPNRRLFEQALTEALADQRRDGGDLALMLVDLDRFKEVNDTLGHHTGDLLLREVAARLRAALREGDTVARLGGDEFGVLLARDAGRAEAAAIAARILERLARPVEVDGMQIDPGASIGIARGGLDGRDGQKLLQRADVALYQAKIQRGRFDFYDPDRDANSTSRLTLAAELREALAVGQIVPHFQPKLDLRSGRVSSLEALARWEHPRRGLLGPDKFVEIAEEAGLMPGLTRVMLEAALSACARWRAADADLVVAVNVAATSLLSDRLVEDVAAALRAANLPGTALELEITESSIMSDPERAACVVRRVAELGVRVAVDDFGTGYTSLGQLKQLPVDALKVDRSFTRGLLTDPSDAAIVQAMIGLAHNLGLEVVAEGVEDEQVLRRLRELGCDVVQGFHISRPVPFARVLPWLAEWQAEPAPAAPAVRGLDAALLPARAA